tara:strand:- start:81 stop:476 length:396 start_codon:yes stop_codon:yes gene_type:complete
MKKLLLILLCLPLLFSCGDDNCVSGDCENGQGTMIFSSGNKYVGEYKDGYYNGQGTLTWADGDKYVGEWKDGKRNGIGTNYWIELSEYHNMPAGSQYEGQWLNDIKHGYGKGTYANGTVKEGLWKEGEFIR